MSDKILQELVNQAQLVPTDKDYEEAVELAKQMPLDPLLTELGRVTGMHLARGFAITGYRPADFARLESLLEAVIDRVVTALDEDSEAAWKFAIALSQEMEQHG